jgi:hypothetical protein
MKNKTLIILAAAFLFLVCSCRKNKTAEDPHNHSLLGKSVNEIRASTAGKWQLQRSTVFICPLLPPCFEDAKSYPQGTGDLIYFLQGDSIKRTKFDGTVVHFNEKASLKKVLNPLTPANPDSVFAFCIQSASTNLSWVIKELKNDTLVINNWGNEFLFLTRKN